MASTLSKELTALNSKNREDSTLDILDVNGGKITTDDINKVINKCKFKKLPTPNL